MKKRQYLVYGKGVLWLTLFFFHYYLATVISIGVIGVGYN